MVVVAQVVGGENEGSAEKRHWPEKERREIMASEKKDPKPLQSKRAVTGRNAMMGRHQEIEKRSAAQKMTEAN